MEFVKCNVLMEGIDVSNGLLAAGTLWALMRTLLAGSGKVLKDSIRACRALEPAKTGDG
jgi:hypothetical protein